MTALLGREPVSAPRRSQRSHKGRRWARANAQVLRHASLPWRSLPSGRRYSIPLTTQRNSAMTKADLGSPKSLRSSIGRCFARIFARGSAFLLHTSPFMPFIDYLLTRRSVSANSLGEPGPNKREIEQIFTAAARVPDHKKLVPWRFLLFGGRPGKSLAKSLRRFAEARRRTRLNSRSRPRPTDLCARRSSSRSSRA